MAVDKSILYSCEESDRINRLIQTQIAPHLFLSCNYAPNPYFIESEDAKFVVGILNLYKFVIDGSIIEKIPYIMDTTMGSTFNRKAFKEEIATVKALRTVYCHNESEISGNDDEVKKVNAWMKKVPQTINDYAVLNRQLQKLASDITDILRQFIAEASKSRKKEVLIGNWENVIGNFYRRPNTKNILVGQLKKFYSARKGLLSMDRAADLDMLRCVKKYYIGDLESKLEEKENNYRTICKKLSLLPEKQAELRRMVDKAEEELNERKKQIISKIETAKINIDNIDRNDYPYFEFYMKELPQRIIDFINNTADTNVYGTLLPQDIVQYIMKQDFDLIIVK